ncbi:MAG TPA: TPM domain-containing protein [Planctomycetota bacterium]|jgi:uncharacterized protein|nr:TPM domain-containing protein [Planctomycetota bacterium]
MTLLIAALLFLAPQEFPRLSEPIQDEAGALNPEEKRLASELVRKLEETDSTQVALLIVRTTGERDISDYALGVARRNGIGQAGKNNGVLIVVAVEDRRVKIEVGTGLEGRLPDALCSRIIRDEMVPHFKNGKIGAGAIAGLTAVVQSVRGEYRGNPSSRKDRTATGFPAMIIIIIIGLIVVSRLSGLGGFAGGYLFGSSMGGWGRGSGSGWGGGGGGGGGWSGGGGSFGGGGASGSW